VTEEADERIDARTLVNLPRWFAAFAVVVAAALFAAGRWPSAVGVLIGSMPVFWIAGRLSRRYSGRLVRNTRRSGAWTMAGINATAVAVILFAGILIGGDFIVIVSTIFGTWMIATAVLLAAVSMLG
jgi:hypothetical protein